MNIDVNTNIASQLARVAAALLQPATGYTLSLLSSEELRSFVVPKVLNFVSAEYRETCRDSLTRLYHRASTTPGVKEDRRKQAVPGKLSWGKGWEDESRPGRLKAIGVELISSSSSLRGQLKSFVDGIEERKAEAAQVRERLAGDRKKTDLTYVQDEQRLQTLVIEMEKLSTRVTDTKRKLDVKAKEMEILQEWVERPTQVPEATAAIPEILVTLPCSEVPVSALNVLKWVIEQFWTSHRAQLTPLSDWSKVWQNVVLRILPKDLFIVSEPTGLGVPRPLTALELKLIGGKRPVDSPDATAEYDMHKALSYYTYISLGGKPRKKGDKAERPAALAVAQTIHIPAVSDKGLLENPAFQAWYAQLVLALPKGTVCPDLPPPPATVITVTARVEEPVVSPPAIVRQEPLPDPKEKEMKVPDVLPKAAPKPDKGKGKEKVRKRSPSPSPAPARRGRRKAKTPPAKEDKKETPAPIEQAAPSGSQPHYPEGIRKKAKAILQLTARDSAPRWACLALVRGEKDAAKGLKDGTLTAETLNAFLKLHPLVKTVPKEGQGIPATPSPPKKGKKPQKEAKDSPATDNSREEKKDAESLKTRWASEARVYKDKDVPLLAKPRSNAEKAYKKLWDKFLQLRKKLSPAGKRTFRLPMLMAADGTRAQPRTKGGASRVAGGDSPVQEAASKNASGPDFEAFMKFFKLFNEFKAM